MAQVSEHYSFAFRLELINKVAGARWRQSSTKTYTIHEQTGHHKRENAAV